MRNNFIRYLPYENCESFNGQKADSSSFNGPDDRSSQVIILTIVSHIHCWSFLDRIKMNFNILLTHKKSIEELAFRTQYYMAQPLNICTPKYTSMYTTNPTEHSTAAIERSTNENDLE